MKNFKKVQMIKMSKLATIFLIKQFDIRVNISK